VVLAHDSLHDGVEPALGSVQISGYVRVLDIFL
jgi:hypothetical protein